MRAATGSLLLFAAIFIFTSSSVIYGQPWVTFGEALATEAKRIINNCRQDFGTPLNPRPGVKQRLAAAVVEGIEVLWDNNKRKLVKNFGFGFSCIVYDAAIASGYESRVTLGQSIIIDERSIRAAENGAALLTGCTGNTRSKLADWPVASLGVPCAAGSAVQAKATTASQKRLICLVYYYPLEGQRPLYPEPYLEVFEALLDTFKPSNKWPYLKPSDHSLINLTKIAAEFIERLVPRTVNMKAVAFRFKLFAVVPLYLPAHPGLGRQRGFLKAYESSAVGLAAAHGHFAVDHLHVPNALNLNSNPEPALPLTLVFIAAVPAGAAYTQDLPGCIFCTHTEQP